MMDVSKHRLSLETMAENGLAERVNAAIPKIIENIRDPNTDAKKKRKLTIVVEFMPDDKRRGISIEFDVVTTIQRMKKFGLPGYIVADPDTREPIIVAFDPDQGNLFDPTKPAPEESGSRDVVPINGTR